MEITNTDELTVSREKLSMLEKQYESAQDANYDSNRTRESTLRSLKRLINQLKEEIARFEIREAV